MYELMADALAVSAQAWPRVGVEMNSLAMPQQVTARSTEQTSSAAGRTVHKSTDRGRWVAIGEAVGAALWATQASALLKGRGHKYVRRVPTGNPKRPWRYFYSVTGGKGLGHHDEFEVGGKFAITHNGTEGHFEIVGVEGDQVTVRHDETGHTETLTREALAAMLREHHADLVQAHAERTARDLKAARKHGTSTQVVRLRAHAAKYAHTRHLVEPEDGDGQAAGDAVRIVTDGHVSAAAAAAGTRATVDYGNGRTAHFVKVGEGDWRQRDPEAGTVGGKPYSDQAIPAVDLPGGRKRDITVTFEAGEAPAKPWTAPEDRNEATKRLRRALRALTGKSWSVRGGKGTGYGWISVDTPKSRRTHTAEGEVAPEGTSDYSRHMSPAERRELGALLGAPQRFEDGELVAVAHHQGHSIRPRDRDHVLRRLEEMAAEHEPKAKKRSKPKAAPKPAQPAPKPQPTEPSRLPTAGRAEGFEAPVAFTGETVEGTTKRRGKTVWSVPHTGKIPDAQFQAMKADAREVKGYYSRKGFTFRDPEHARAFVAKWGHADGAEHEQVQAPGTPPAEPVGEVSSRQDVSGDASTPQPKPDRKAERAAAREAKRRALVDEHERLTNAAVAGPGFTKHTQRRARSLARQIESLGGFKPADSEQAPEQAPEEAAPEDRAAELEQAAEKAEKAYRRVADAYYRATKAGRMSVGRRADHDKRSAAAREKWEKAKRDLEQHRHHDPYGPREPVVAEGKRYGFVRAPGRGAGPSYYVWDSKLGKVVDHPPTATLDVGRQEIYQSVKAWNDAHAQGTTPHEQHLADKVERWKVKVRELESGSKPGSLGHWIRSMRGNVRAHEDVDRHAHAESAAILKVLTDERRRRSQERRERKKRGKDLAARARAVKETLLQHPEGLNTIPGGASLDSGIIRAEAGTATDADLRELARHTGALEQAARGRGAAGTLAAERAQREAGGAPTAEGLGVEVHASQLPYDRARAAHGATSHVPEKRAEQEMRGFVEHVEGVARGLAEAAGDDPEKRKRAAEMLAEYRDGYRKRLLAKLDAQSRTMSAMVVGPAKFPTRRNQKRQATEDRRREELLEWSKKRRRRMVNEIDPQTISSDRDDAVDLLKEKLADHERLHKRMKAANRIVRSKKLSADEKVAKLGTDLGMAESAARALLEPDFAGRVGYAPYQLTNNNATIKRLRERIANVEREQSSPTTEHEFDGGMDDGGVTITDDAESNRIMLRFDGKPDAEMRAKLKSHGFRWSRRNEAWQRHRTDNTRATLKHHFGWDLSGESTLTKGFDGGRVEHPIPGWLGARLYFVQRLDLLKGVGHKYIRRVPAGADPKTGRTRYRYYYSVSGGAGLGHADEFQVGAAFRLRHGGQDGHFHVVGKTHDGKFRVRHDESGHESEMSPETLRHMLNAQHADAVSEHRERLGREIKAAAKHGSKKQRERLHAEARQHGHHDLVDGGGKHDDVRSLSPVAIMRELKHKDLDEGRRAALRTEYLRQMAESRKKAQAAAEAEKKAKGKKKTAAIRAEGGEGDADGPEPLKPTDGPDRSGKAIPRARRMGRRLRAVAHRPGRRREAAGRAQAASRTSPTASTSGASP